MQGKPFAIVGVNINGYEPRKLKEVMDKEQLHFRSFTDRTDGEGLGVISSAWNMVGTPSIFVIDARGVIRYVRRGIPDRKALDVELDKVIREAEGNAPKKK